MSKSRSRSTLNRAPRKPAPTPSAEPPRMVEVERTPQDDIDDIKLELAQLAALARVIERHCDGIDCRAVVGDLTGGQLASLAGLLHSRLAALDERVWGG